MGHHRHEVLGPRLGQRRLRRGRAGRVREGLPGAYGLEGHSRARRGHRHRQIDKFAITCCHLHPGLTIDNSRRAAYGYDQRVEAFGNLGKAASDNYHDFNSVLATEAGYRRPPLQNFFLERYGQSYLDQWAAFLNYVRSDVASPASGADGRAPLVIAQAAHCSMTENRPVHIAEIDN